MELVRTKEELKEIAALMAKEIEGQSNVVSRFNRVVQFRAQYKDGKAEISTNGQTNVNKENMGKGIYTSKCFLSINPQEYMDVVVSRDLQEQRLTFQNKGVPLPSETRVHYEEIPTGIDMHDPELLEFTRGHLSSTLARMLKVHQNIVVNSEGGVAIQSIPLMNIEYWHGYDPIPTARNISVVCNNRDDVARMPELIKFLSDPTLDKRIKNSKSFSEAFHELHGISRLKHGSLQDAGITLKGLYDVVVLSGVPVHEIFGHHFEEPIWHLNYGETGTFKAGQNTGNRNINITDNPNQRVAGFRSLGTTHFDAYGRTREVAEHINEGIVTGQFLGCEYADQEKLPSYLGLAGSKVVGHAGQGVDGLFPQPRMTCTTMDGETQEVDLEGKILIVPHGGSTDPLQKSYMVQAQECYVVRDGEPRRVIPLQMSGGINQALANVVLLDDWNYQVGSCGKPDPISRSRSAGVDVSQLTRTQLWQGQQVYPTEISARHVEILQK